MEKYFDIFVVIDLETGVDQLSYSLPHGCKEEKLEVGMEGRGENFEIVEEISLFDYIIQEGWLQDEYDVNELLEFYNNKVKPIIEEKEQNDLTLTSKFRQNI